MAQQDANKEARARVVRALKGMVDVLDGMASEDRHRQDGGWQSWGDAKWADDLLPLPGELDLATRRWIGTLRGVAIEAFDELIKHRVLADTQRLNVRVRMRPPERPLADARLHAIRAAEEIEALASEIEGADSVEPVVRMPMPDGVSEPALRTLGFLEARSFLPIAQIAKLAEIQERTARTHLKELKDQGLVEKGSSGQGFRRTK